MTKLLDNAPLVERLQQLSNAARRAHLHAELAARELKTITLALSPEILSSCEEARDEDEEQGEATQTVFDGMTNLVGEAFNQLILAARALMEVVEVADEEEDGEDENDEDADR